MKSGAAGGGGFFDKKGFFWKLLASGLVPVMMAGAYAFMAATSESDNTGKAWMALGFVFVLVLWWIFKLTTRTAALARAVSVGDSDRILELVPAKSVAETRVYCALAYEMRGAWDEAIATALEVPRTPRVTPAQRTAAAAIQVGALVEAGRVGEARTLYAAELAGVNDPPVVDRSQHEVVRAARLALGRVAGAEGDLDASSAALERIMRDVRSGAAHRAIAHTYAARIATTRGDAAAATKHRAEAVRLAPASWMARSV